MNVGCVKYFSVSIEVTIWLLNFLNIVAQSVKNLPALQDTWIQSLGQEHPLEKEMATTSVFLPGKISWTKEPDGRLQELDMT